MALIVRVNQRDSFAGFEGRRTADASDADKKAFQDAVKPVWDKYGPKYADMIKRIQDTK